MYEASVRVKLRIGPWRGSRVRARPLWQTGKPEKREAQVRRDGWRGAIGDPPARLRLAHTC